jgi:hypothetical protein
MADEQLNQSKPWESQLLQAINIMNTNFLKMNETMNNMNETMNNMNNNMNNGFNRMNER